MIRARTLPLLAAICALIAALLPGFALAQERANHIAARLVAEGPVEPGRPLTLAIAFDPEPGWHGYWSNPGDAGYGMELDWQLPEGWQAGESQYPVPRKLVIGGLMNHVYKGPYAVLVDLAVPERAAVQNIAPIVVDAQWLACTDEICVPEQARLTLDLSSAPPQPTAFDRWRAAIPALLDRPVTYAIDGKRLRIAVPLPAAVALPEPHVFVGQRDLVQYAAVQTFSREGDLLIAEIPLADAVVAPDPISGILSFGDGDGVRFVGEKGTVPAAGVPLKIASADTGPLWLLLLGALAGGLLLNVMPCVFPILSLKALSLARAGESDARARAEGLAYTAGVVIATLALGVLLLGLRSAGEAVGWAFQLQEPAVVAGLLVLAVAITANLAGLYELPALSVTRGGEPASAFATGLLAAFVATPCTGPFMAAAMGAALLLPPLQALLLFGALGLGLALPFLLLGFVPPLRRMLPRPGPWMVRFQRWMAVPMGLTAVALVWLCWRLGGAWFTAVSLILALGVLVALWAAGRRQHVGKPAGRTFALLAAPFAVFAAVALPAAIAEQPTAARAQDVIPAQPFSEARLSEARASGKPVFVWFTADWCLTCKVNEGVAIEREATKAAFEKAGVVALVGDWTRRDPEITRFLTRQGAAGVPLYMWYPAGGEGVQLPQVLTPESLVTLAEGTAPAGS
ncbi:Thiol:disulfide interchange protein DsbD precursor [Tsuneonella dongtanensis]|uniref:Thiol:disulfide interchange protein DsbD n=1 Tax=Tsuneonella dongtanensis TaxID=692370 RepID=A0A1B2AC48_9SPHN|nr:protein-disulfide reductase DsbD domain-containing protein [Tsuneonella dongtanensis]ANY19742.1 Thiol:disulfide interchange protein DsbD precursor [Tsuneonella dongtanensis]